MRVLLLLCCLVLLCVGVLCVLGDVSVPYKSCASSSSHLTLTSLTANEWPPVTSSWFNVTVNGTLDEDVTSGSWSASGSFDGFPLPSSSGDISQFKPLPWPSGPIQFDYDVSVRSLPSQHTAHQRSTTAVLLSPAR